VRAVGSSQQIQQLHKQLVVLALSSHPAQAARMEVERPTDPLRLAVCPWSRKGLLCLPLRIQQKPTLGLVSKPPLVLKERPRCLHHLQDVLESGELLLPSLLDVFLWRDGARPSPAVLQTMERTANRLPARLRKPFAEELE
jgi:hypothetical protein